MRQPGWEGSLREKGYMYMYGWVPLLFTWNYHIVNQLYSNKIKSLKKITIVFLNNENRRIRSLRTAAIQENFLEETTTRRSKKGMFGEKSKEVFRNFKTLVWLVGHRWGEKICTRVRVCFVLSWFDLVAEKKRPLKETTQRKGEGRGGRYGGLTPCGSHTEQVSSLPGPIHTQWVISSWLPKQVVFDQFLDQVLCWVPGMGDG